MIAAIDNDNVERRIDRYVGNTINAGEDEAKHKLVSKSAKSREE